MVNPNKEKEEKETIIQAILPPEGLNWNFEEKEVNTSVGMIAVVDFETLQKISKAQKGGVLRLKILK